MVVKRIGPYLLKAPNTIAFRREKDPLNVNFLAIFWHFPNPLIKLNQKMLQEQGKVKKVAKWVTLTRLFLCETQKPSSDFPKTQIAKFWKNPVLGQKPSSKIVKNSVFSYNFSKNQLNLAKLSSKFPKTQFQKCKNPVFQKTWEVWISRTAHKKKA